MKRRGSPCCHVVRAFPSQASPPQVPAALTLLTDATPQRLLFPSPGRYAPSPCTAPARRSTEGHSTARCCNVHPASCAAGHSVTQCSTFGAAQAHRAPQCHCATYLVRPRTFEDSGHLQKSHEGVGGQRAVYTFTRCHWGSGVATFTHGFNTTHCNLDTGLPSIPRARRCVMSRRATRMPHLVLQGRLVERPAVSAEVVGRGVGPRLEDPLQHHGGVVHKSAAGVVRHSGCGGGSSKEAANRWPAGVCFREDAGVVCAR